MTNSHPSAAPVFDAEYSRFEQLRGKFSPLHAEFETDRRYLKGNYGGSIIPADWADDGLALTVPPTANDAIENASDHILTFPRTFVPVRPVGTNVIASMAVAEKQRAFHAMFWDNVFVETDPLGRGKKDLIKGMLPLKVELRWDLLPPVPEEGIDDAYRLAIHKVTRNAFPWRITVLPKESVYPDPNDTWNPRYFYYGYRCTYESAVAQYGDAVPAWLADATDPFGMVEMVEMYSQPKGSDRGQYVVWCEGERVWDKFNPYSWETPMSTPGKQDWTGRIPFMVGDPGWGDVDPDNLPEDKFTSIIKPARSVMVAEARMLTELEAWLRLYVFPTLLTKGMPDDDNHQVRLGPGGHIDTTEGQEASVMSWGEAPVTLLNGLSRVNQYADQSSKFGTLGGIAQRGVDTASEADQNVRNASTKLAGPINMLRRMVIRINAWVLQDIENVLEVPVTLFGATANAPSEVTLNPTDINGYYMTAVEMETSDEAALDLRKARVWADIYNVFPGLKETTALTKIGISNATEEQDGRMVEDIMRSDPAQQVMMQMFLTAIGDMAQPVKDAFMQTMAQRMAGGKVDPTAAPASPEQVGLLPPGPAATADPTAAQPAAAAAQQARAAAPERQYQ